jgi:hypothetical protein
MTDRAAAIALAESLLTAQGIDVATLTGDQLELLTALADGLVAGLPVAVPVKHRGFYAAAPSAIALNAFRNEVVAFFGPTYAVLDASDFTGRDPLADLLRAAGYGHVFRVARAPGVDVGEFRAKLVLLTRVRRQVPPRAAAAIRSVGDVLHEFEWAAAQADAEALDAALRELVRHGEMSDDNLRFLRTRRHAALGQWELLWEEHLVDFLLHVARPAQVTDALLAAVWERHLAGVAASDVVAAFADVREEYAPIFTALSAAVSTPARRSAMLFAVTHEPVLTETVDRLLAEDGDEQLHALAALAMPASPLRVPPVDAARAAASDEEWDRVTELLRAEPQTAETATLLTRAAFFSDVTDAALDALRAVRALTPEERKIFDAVPSVARILPHVEAVAAPVLAVADRAPRSWREWLDVVSADPAWREANRLAERGASDWPADLLNDEAAATAFGERLLDAAPLVRHAVVGAAPYLDRYLDRVPDGAGTVVLSRALFEVLVLDDASSAGDIAIGAKLVERVFGSGPDVETYRQLIRDVIELWESRLASYEHLDWGLAVVDAGARSACPDVEARTRLLAAVADVLRRSASRVLDGERRYALALFEECDASGLVPLLKATAAPAEEAGPSPWALLSGRRVGLHCLFQPIVKRFAEVVPALAPGADVVSDSSHDCSPPLRALCGSADVLVVVTQHAKHAATECVDAHASPDRVVRTRGARVGFAGVYRALEEHLVARAATAGAAAE